VLEDMSKWAGWTVDAKGGTITNKVSPTSIMRFSWRPAPPREFSPGAAYNVTITATAETGKKERLQAGGAIVSGLEMTPYANRIVAAFAEDGQSNKDYKEVTITAPKDLLPNQEYTIYIGAAYGPGVGFHYKSFQE